MPVSLPTSADVRKIREQAAKDAAARAELARTPLLAFLGAGDLAYSTVTRAVAEARTRANAQADDVQHRVAELPHRLTTDELRKLVAEFRAQAEQAYADFAERGEQAWGRIRKQPQVRQAIATVESYTEKLDARVDVLVDDAHDAAEKALATVTTQTRSTGERVARASQRFSGQAAATVTEVTTDASQAVAEAGAEVAETINDAGAEVAHDARSTSRKAANRTAPKTTAPKTTVSKTTAPNNADRKPAARRTGSADKTRS